MKSQNFAIVYNINGQQRFGVIENFYKLDLDCYCVVKKCRKTKSLSSNINIERILEKFYMVCVETRDLELIKMDTIVTKATYLKNDDEIFFSSCCDLDEHD